VTFSKALAKFQGWGRGGGGGLTAPGMHRLAGAG
jgi:hypothetical protein